MRKARYRNITDNFYFCREPSIPIAFQAYFCFFGHTQGDRSNCGSFNPIHYYYITGDTNSDGVKDYRDILKCPVISPSPSPTPLPINCNLDNSFYNTNSEIALTDKYEFNKSEYFSILNINKTAYIDKINIKGILRARSADAGRVGHKILNCLITDENNLPLLESLDNYGPFPATTDENNKVYFWTTLFFSREKIFNSGIYRLYCKVNNIAGGGIFYWADQVINNKHTNNKSREVFLCEETITPSPTPSITLNQPWIKLKNSSFYSNEKKDIFIPLNLQPFDSDDNYSPYFNIGNSGIFSSPNYQLISNNPEAKISNNQNVIIPYKTRLFFNKNIFLQYLNSRKKYFKIGDLSQITKSGVYYLTKSSLVIDSQNQAFFKNKELVLITDNDVYFSIEEFKPTSGYLAIISPSINFFYNNIFTKTAYGIFIGDIINTGKINDGLKIVGNLITNKLNNERNQINNNQKPSIFIVFDVNFYLKLLPYLSIKKYDWKQLQ